MLGQHLGAEVKDFGLWSLFLHSRAQRGWLNLDDLQANVPGSRRQSFIKGHKWQGRCIGNRQMQGIPRSRARRVPIGKDGSLDEIIMGERKHMKRAFAGDAELCQCQTMGWCIQISASVRERKSIP
jgi:hypothetical protein